MFGKSAGFPAELQKRQRDNELNLPKLNPPELDPVLLPNEQQTGK
jgi:hypothetical protein